MNLVEKYSIDDTLDTLIDKYGTDWDKLAPASDPDLKIIMKFRKAIKSSHKKANLIEEYEAVEGYDRYLQKSFFQVLPYIQQGYSKSYIYHKTRVSLTDINEILRTNKKLKRVYDRKRKARQTKRQLKRNATIVIEDIVTSDVRMVSSVKEAASILNSTTVRVYGALNGTYNVIGSRYRVQRYQKVE